MLAAFFAAIFGGSADVLNKLLLGKMKLGFRNYLPIIFSLLAIISLFFLPINFYFNAAALSVKYLIIFLVMVASAGIWNYLLAKSLEVEPLHEYEVIVLMSPLITVILAAIFLPSERNIIIFVAGLVSSLVLAVSRFRKDHFVVSKTAKQTLLAIFFVALESVCLKILLDFYSPALLYFVRVIILAIVFLAVYRPSFKLFRDLKTLIILIITALLGSFLMILKYYALQSIGLVLTTIIMLIVPLITYIASYYYFNEKKNFAKDLICAIVIVVCIILSLIYK